MSEGLPNGGKVNLIWSLLTTDVKRGVEVEGVTGAESDGRDEVLVVPIHLTFVDPQFL